MSFTKEAYKKLNQNKEGVRFIRPIGEYTLNEIIETLTELEQLKRDVKRYFELLYKHCELHEIDEYYDLEEKLSKVGKEDV